jgi:cytochrome c-type biogenesis protein
MNNVSYATAFIAGLLSFVSPCVLPLIPGYLSFISGKSLEEMRGGSTGAAEVSARRQVLIASLAFVLGFSLVFVALGASASAIGRAVGENKVLLGRIGGLVIIVFGLHTAGVFRIKWLEMEKRVHTRQRPSSLLGAMLVGVAFAFGWTPCIGPILGGILAIAAAQDTLVGGVTLLAVYSAGLGIPFLATSVAINRFFAASARIRRHFHAIEVASGVLLVGIGLLLLSNQLTLIAGFLQRFIPTLG